MARFRKKPVEIEAVRYEKGMEDGWAWLSGDGGHKLYDTEDAAKTAAGGLHKNCVPIIKTLEGFHEILEGDWIITGVRGERYPIKPDIFAATYDRVGHEEMVPQNIADAQLKDGGRDE